MTETADRRLTTDDSEVSSGGSVAPMTRSQNRVSRDSFSEIKFFAMKSGFVCPARPSSILAPDRGACVQQLHAETSYDCPALLQPHTQFRHVTCKTKCSLAELMTVDHDERVFARCMPPRRGVLYSIFDRRFSLSKSVRHGTLIPRTDEPARHSAEISRTYLINPSEGR